LFRRLAIPRNQRGYRAESLEPPWSAGRPGPQQLRLREDAQFETTRVFAFGRAAGRDVLRSGRAGILLAACEQSGAVAIFLLRFFAGCVTSNAAMFSLQKLLGKEDKFFGLLEASAEEARTSVLTLVKLSKDFEKLTGLEDFTYSRRRDKQITQEISAAVYTTFITAIEREDIDELSNALYKIPKTVEKFTERILIAPQHVRGIDFSKQIGLLERATELVLELVKSLRNGMDLEKVKELNDKLQFLEGEADRHMMTLYKDLFSGHHDPVQIIALKDLYELLEKVIDRCRTVGNVISRIVLKNS
jgi:uncharacterized protein Yka (UPF0111/DUF47 family)